MTVLLVKKLGTWSKFLKQCDSARCDTKKIEQKFPSGPLECNTVPKSSLDGAGRKQTIENWCTNGHKSNKSKYSLRLEPVESQASSQSWRAWGWEYCNCLKSLPFHGYCEICQRTTLERSYSRMDIYCTCQQNDKLYPCGNDMNGLSPSLPFWQIHGLKLISPALDDELEIS